MLKTLGFSLKRFPLKVLIKFTLRIIISCKRRYCNFQKAKRRAYLRYELRHSVTLYFCNKKDRVRVVRKSKTYDVLLAQLEDKMERNTLYKCIGGSIAILVLTIIVLLIVFLPGNTGSETLLKAGPKIVIDHDGGADDAMAVFLALLYEKYFNGPPIIGLTTANGNVGEDQVFINSQRFLDIAQRRDIPIYRGCTAALVQPYTSDYYFGLDGLGDMENVVYEPTAAQPGHAVNALIDLSKKYEGELTVIVIGPVTNIAVAMSLDPKFLSRLAHLYVAAGNIYSGNNTEAEFNALMDVEAYHVVAENALKDKLTLIPFSPFHELHNISLDWRLNVLGAIDTPIMQTLNEFQRISNSNKPGNIWTDLDPLAMAMVLNNTLIGESKCFSRGIILCGKQRGVTTQSDEIVHICNDTNINTAFPAPDEYYKAFMYEVFSAELNNVVL